MGTAGTQNINGLLETLDAVTDIYQDLLKLAKNFAENGISKNTKAAYTKDFERFGLWCYRQGKEYLPAEVETVCAYLADMSKKKYSTISRTCVSIKRFHLAAELASPTDSQKVKDVLKGIRRHNGIGRDAAKPIMWQDCRAMISSQTKDIRGRRNAALLAIGWTCALRRSEIVALDVPDIEINNAGMFVKIRKSKTDQDGKGEKIFVPRSPSQATCPVRLIESYIDLLFFNKSGPLFRRVRRTNDMMFYDWGNAARLTEQTVTDVVKDAARLIGLNPLDYSAHSLRRGFATQCGQYGIPERFIMRQTRHRSTKTLREYIDDGELILNNPLTRIFSAGSSPPALAAKLAAHPTEAPLEPAAAVSQPEPFEWEPSFHDDRNLE
jgi:site-specific recombinase XerD